MLSTRLSVESLALSVLAILWMLYLAAQTVRRVRRSRRQRLAVPTALERLRALHGTAADVSSAYGESERHDGRPLHEEVPPAASANDWGQ